MKLADQSGAPTRPKNFNMQIQGGMLDALGVNMYSTIGKCLVEFAANSHDSESDGVDIEIPFEAIVTAREELRGKARVEVEAGSRDKRTLLLDPLPEEICITIKDRGHGMLPAQIQDKFLPLNRNRRLDGVEVGEKLNHYSETRKRRVMGRKGLGKMAAFGAAECVTIRTKRKGESFSTEFTMDFRDADKAHDITKKTFPAIYLENQPIDEQGTTLTLSRLRCDALKASEETIAHTLALNFFGISKDDFAIRLNTRIVTLEPAEYDFTYPADVADSEVDADQFGTSAMSVNDTEKIALRYKVLFRMRRDDLPEEEKTAKTDRWKKCRPLDNKQRGARVYVNSRLALGPSLLDLDTGMHNFHAQAYMECIVHADELDHFDIDFVNTNRSDLRRDNEIVDKLISTVTALMRDGILEHSKHKDTWVTKRLEDTIAGSNVLRRLKQMPKKSQASATKIVKTLASEHGATSEMFTNLAPLLLDSMNAGEILVKLIQMESNPENLRQIIEALAELTKVENQDVLKLYRGRRDGIEALDKIVKRGVEEWKKRQFENELHQLLKAQPWLIRPEYSRFFTSDKPMGTVADSLSKELGIDTHAAAAAAADLEKRPDLVFALVEPNGFHHYSIVELKSPTIPLSTVHLMQLDDYVMTVRRIVEAEGHTVSPTVTGHLIGAMPAHNTAKNAELSLLGKIKSNDLPIGLEVIGLEAMVNRARQTHSKEIEALETDEGNESDEAEN